MGKRFVGTLSAVMLLAGTFVVATATAASATRYFAHGNMQCTIGNGTVNYAPSLRRGVSATTRFRASGNLSCTGETGLPNVTIASAKFVAIGNWFGGDCDTIAPSPDSWTGGPFVTMKISWFAAGGIVRETDVSWGLPDSSSTEPYAYHFRGGTISSVGVAGSYFGASASVDLVSNNISSSTACAKRLRGGWSLGAGSQLTFEAPPSVTGVTPGSGTLGASNLNVTVQGQDFRAGDTLAFSGTGITVNSATVLDSNDMQANISIDPGALAGERDVTVTNSTLGSGTCTSCFMVAPIVSGVTPATVGQGANGRNITVTGQGFANGAFVSFANPGITSNYTAFVDGGTLNANISVAPTTPPGAYDVTVVDPGMGIGVCTGCLTVTAGPTISTVSPSPRGAGATNQNLTITGTGFNPGATAAISSGVTVNSTTYVSPTQLTANVSIAAGATVGSRTVTVTNTDGGSASCNCFAVSKGPNVTDWNATGSNGFYHFDEEWRGDHYELREMYSTDVAVTGTGFQPGATVTYSGSAFITVNSTTYVSSTKIKQNITIDVLDFAAHGLPTDRAITLTNPDGGAFTCQGCVVLLV